ncbi:MAG: NGG1p interacting factor NIF3 [Candidatus Aceula meridiana]|nr:NGG1p interacting factor NIF3 [Candidatus Aceula meridiana]
MQLSDIYQFCVKEGMAQDSRTKKEVAKKIVLTKGAYRKLPSTEKKFFDKESLRNPYADTRILFGASNTPVKRILVGIDIGVGEVLLADRLSSKGKKIDLIISHHPLGDALAGLYDVMDLQADLLTRLGIEESIASSLMKKRIGEVERSLHSSNHQRVVDAAKSLGIPLMCCHTAADNHVATYLQKRMDKQKPKTLQRVVDLLLKEPEYKLAAAKKAGPKILVGKPTCSPKKIVLDMTGGTEGSKEVFARLSQAGVKTLIGMHMSENHLKKVKDEHLHVVIAGHIASDNLGLNLLFDKLIKKDKGLEILECSGFRRVKR